MPIPMTTGPYWKKPGSCKTGEVKFQVLGGFGRTLEFAGQVGVGGLHAVLNADGQQQIDDSKQAVPGQLFGKGQGKVHEVA